MSKPFIKTKPSLMEAGLPCSSLSAECQRDNNARQRPPQNRLHIWWARRPPTVCRVALVSALLPHKAHLPESVLPPFGDEPSEADLENLAGRQKALREFFGGLITDVQPSPLSNEHRVLLRSLGILGDADRAYRRLAAAEGADNGRTVTLGSTWGYRHERAFAVSPTSELLAALHSSIRGQLGLKPDEPITVLDFMAGGGAIPLEGVRYGFKVFANDLNPVAALVQKATLEYPARFGRTLGETIRKYAFQAHEAVRKRLTKFFPFQPPAEWWPEEAANAKAKFSGREIVSREAATDRDPIKNTYLWCRVIACPKCSLNVPLSTNFHIVTKKGKPEAAVAAFPEVPTHGNDCTFRIVGAAQWKDCRWPKPDFVRWHPSGDVRNKVRQYDGPTCIDGDAICPRCGNIVTDREIKDKAFKQRVTGGLGNQMMTVCSQVPVKLTYRKGEVKVRYLWRFRAPTDADLAAVAAAEAELRANEGRWANLIPPEEVPEIMEDSRPRDYGMTRWRDFFSPRQLLANITLLDEIRNASQRAKSELPIEQAEAVAVYLSLILSKVINYNSVSSSWHDGRRQMRGMMMGHDFRYHPGYAEMEAARETVMWGASQVINSYTQLAGLIHGEAVSLVDGDDEDEGEADTEDDVEVDENDEDATSAAVASAEVHLRPEVIVPTVTNNDAAALETPAPGTVHLICVDPPYYNNVQYSELSNFFYVWLKRALGDWPGLEPFFREELAETNREAVANAVRWKAEAEKEQGEWQTRFESAFAALEGARGDNDRKLTKPVRTAKAKEAAGPEPLTAGERAERFYEAKMAAVFRRAKQLLHPAGRMVVMFNHKMTKAWRALGKALIEAGFEIRTSIPIHTEAESSLNIRGLDAARSTVLLLCLPREEQSQVTGNWGRVQDRIATVARNAAGHFQKQGIFGTDLYLSALGPALGEVGRHWPITDVAGRSVDITEALDKAYAAVGQFRLNQILTEELPGKVSGMVEGYSADTADKNTQSLWLWLDTFSGAVADSDDVRKLAKSLDIEPDTFKKLKLIESESDLFTLKAPQDVDLVQLARQQSGEQLARGRAAREGDVWEERKFPGFLGAAVWNAISLMAGGDEMHRGLEPLKRWLRASGYGDQPDFRGAYAVTLYLLEQAFGKRKDDDPWKQATTEARRGWSLALADWRG
jgi:adenine-specific DNA methylase